MHSTYKSTAEHKSFLLEFLEVSNKEIFHIKSNGIIPKAMQSTIHS